MRRPSPPGGRVSTMQGSTASLTAPSRIITTSASPLRTSRKLVLFGGSRLSTSHLRCRATLVIRMAYSANRPLHLVRRVEFDVSRSRSLLNLTLSTIPPLEAAIQKTIYRIAVLTGQQPTALTTDLFAPVPLPSVIPPLALSNPEFLLRRRPDIRAAERSLAAATARIGIATADLFPRVTFIGSVGLQAETFAGLGKNGADTWNFGPRSTWAPPALGRVQERIRAADARTEASLAFYERTVLTALEETEGALVDFGQEQSRQQFLATSAQASQKAADLAHQRYEGGVTDFLSVLDAERTLLEAQDRLAASQTRTVTALVAVYKALGGGITVTNSK